MNTIYNLGDTTVFDAVTKTIRCQHSWISSSGTIKQLSYEFWFPNGAVFAFDDKTGHYFLDKRLELPCSFFLTKRGRELQKFFQESLTQITGVAATAAERRELTVSLANEIDRGSCYGQATLSLIASARKMKSGQAKTKVLNQDILFFQLLSITRYAALNLFGRAKKLENSPKKVLELVQRIQASVDALEREEIGAMSRLTIARSVEKGTVDELKKELLGQKGPFRITMAFEDKVHTVALFLDGPFEIFNSQVGTVAYTSRDLLIKDFLKMIQPAIEPDSRTRFSKMVKIESFSVSS
jgi:hypothetical protein